MKIGAILSTILPILLCGATSGIAAEEIFEGPFYRCPDAHGEEQIARFETIDLSGFPMRIASHEAFVIEGVQAHVEASRTGLATMANGGPGDPIEAAYMQLGEEIGATVAGGPDNLQRQLAAICFAVTPPPEDQSIDGPFIYMPGHIVEAGAPSLGTLDRVHVPAHLYLVVSFSGPLEDIGSLRFTLSNDFFPKYGAMLGLVRDDQAPNLMISAFGEQGFEPIQHLEMWTPILPISVNHKAPWVASGDPQE